MTPPKTGDTLNVMPFGRWQVLCRMVISPGNFSIAKKNLNEDWRRCARDFYLVAPHLRGELIQGTPRAMAQGDLGPNVTEIELNKTE